MNTHPIEQWRVDQQKTRGAKYPRKILARQLGCSPARYTQITKHGELPSMALASKIRAFTGISIDELASVVEAAE